MEPVIFHPVRRIYNPRPPAEPITKAALDSTEAVTFIWDDGTPTGYFDADINDILSIEYTTLHACSLSTVMFYADGTGRPELHIWGDFSNQPDITIDLIPPILLDVAAHGEWITVDLDSLCGSVVIPPLTEFHIGFVIGDAGFHIYAADNSTPYVSHFYDISEDAWYSIGTTTNGNPLLIRGIGKYYDIRTNFWFTDVTTEAGLSIVGSHVSIGDYDLDGKEDMLNDGTIWRNRGDGTFENATSVPSGRTFWDYDNDGRLDIIAGDDHLWHNDGGTFTDVSSTIGAALLDTCPFMSPGIADFDKDGYPDLYICTGEDWLVDHSNPYPDFYFVNRGDHFNDATDSVGMEIVKEVPYYGRIAVTCDFDKDWDIDLYIGNYRLKPNRLFVNYGDGTFEELARITHVQGDGVYIDDWYYGHTIGAQWADVNNDRSFDLFVANLAHPRFLDFSNKSMLYINEGPPNYRFHDAREEWGIAYYETHSSCVFGDYDNDGWLDLYISCVYDGYHSFLYHNTGAGGFELVNYESGIYLNDSWGAAWFDYDKDGDLDLIARHNTGTANGMHLFRNDIGNAKNWLQIELEGTISDKYAIGAVAEAFASSLGFWQARQVDAVAGTEGTSQGYVLHFGMNNATWVDTLIVRWTNSGIADTFTHLLTNNRYRVIEGVGIESITEKGAKPEQIRLLAYPNPFNSSCRLSVSLPKADGELSLISLDGRVAMQKDLHRGANSVRIDAKNLPAGVYLARIISGGEQAVQRIMLVK
jgi:hypothetical protein